MNTENGFEKKILQLKTDYNSNHKSSFFFKNTFKQNCAGKITNEIGIDTLLRKTIYLIPDKNQIYLDYTIFKCYATPENYLIIVDFILHLVVHCINRFGNYEVHVNLNGFSISACDRYKDVIKLFCDKCISSESRFCEKLINMYIYNTPSVFQQISILLRPFIDSSIVGKMVLYDKKTSEPLLVNIQSK